MPLIVNLLECRSVKCLWQALRRLSGECDDQLQEMSDFLHFKGLRSWWALRSSARVSEVMFPRNFMLHQTETCVYEQKRCYQYLIPFWKNSEALCAKFLCKHLALTASISFSIQAGALAANSPAISTLLRLLQSKTNFLIYLIVNRGCGERRQLRPNGERYARCVCLRTSFMCELIFGEGKNVRGKHFETLFQGWKSQQRERQTYFFIPLVCERVHTRST